MDNDPVKLGEKIVADMKAKRKSLGWDLIIGGIIMACFIVPTTEAIVTTVANKIINNKEKSTDKDEKTAANAAVFI